MPVPSGVKSLADFLEHWMLDLTIKRPRYSPGGRWQVSLEGPATGEPLGVITAGGPTLADALTNVRARHKDRMIAQGRWDPRPGGKRRRQDLADEVRRLTGRR